MRWVAELVRIAGGDAAALAWMANLRDALTAMWDYARDKPNFVIVKLKDGAALLGLALAMVVSLGLSAVSSGPIMRRVVEVLNLLRETGRGRAEDDERGEEQAAEK